MKKILFSILLITLTTILSSCQDNKEMFSVSYFNYMYTYIGIDMYVSEDDYVSYEEEIRHVFETYHQLTTSYDPLPIESQFKNNVYSINEQKNQRLEIDKELYDILVRAKAYHELTGGYFDVTLGTPVKLWKTLIENKPEMLSNGVNIFIHTYLNDEVKKSGVVIESTDDTINVQFENSIETYRIDELEYELEVSEAQFLNIQNQIEALNVESPEMILEKENDTYYVTFNASSQMIDLGAFSKGYATNIVKEYLINKGVEYFSISAGSSSIAVGKNINRPEQNNVFIVSLTDPMYTSSVFNSYYGLIHLKDTSVATSGNFEQYTLFEGIRYHHIISPKTYYPVNTFYALTIVGEDAGLLDALSTALYAMDITTFETFMNEYQNQLNIQVIAFVQDGTILKFTDDLYFEGTRR